MSRYQLTDRLIEAAPQPPTTEQSSAVQQPQVEQEPIAWANINKQYDITHTSNKKTAWAKTPLYTNPQPKREPLTDEQIAEIACTPAAVPGSYIHSFARAIERAVLEVRNEIS